MKKPEKHPRSLKTPRKNPRHSKKTKNPRLDQKTQGVATLFGSKSFSVMLFCNLPKHYKYDVLKYE